MKLDLCQYCENLAEPLIIPCAERNAAVGKSATRVILTLRHKQCAGTKYGIVRPAHWSRTATILQQELISDFVKTIMDYVLSARNPTRKHCMN